MLGSLLMNFFMCLETDFHVIIFSLECWLQEGTCQVEVVKATAQKSWGQDFLVRKQPFAHLNGREHILYACPSIPPSPVLPTPPKTTTHGGQPTNVWKQIKYRPGHCGCTISTTKWERKKQYVFHKTNFIQFKWFWDYVLNFLGAKMSFLLYSDANSR